MALEVEGVLHKKFETEKKTETFQAREFVIQMDGQYPQYVKFQLTQDRCGAIDPFNEGDKIKVFFDLRGREWNGKYFTNLNAWKIEKISINQPQPMEKTPIDDSGFPSQETPFTNFADSTDGDTTKEDLDDLPF